MSVIPLTIFFSLLLSGVFVVLFLLDQRHRGLGGPERESLLPLADEEAVVEAPPPAPASGADGIDQSATPGHSDLSASCIRAHHSHDRTKDHH